jgi:flagellin-specific chaperone FliS
MDRRYLDVYRQHQVEGMSRNELVLTAFELGIKGCRAKDRGLVRDVLMELIAGLDFSHRDVAGSFLVLYDYAMRELREGKFETPHRILAELHEAWSEALKKEQTQVQ